jgi:hypothetical protein
VSTEEEFLKALMAIPLMIEETIEYRFHYNQNGDIYMCTMRNHPTDTDYLVVSEKEYYNYSEYRIVDGKLKTVDKTTGYHVQLKRSNQGCRVVKNHAGIILANNEEYRDIEFYEIRNS